MQVRVRVRVWDESPPLPLFYLCSTSSFYPIKEANAIVVE